MIQDDLSGRLSTRAPSPIRKTQARNARVQDCGAGARQQDPSATAPRRDRMEDRGDKVRRFSASPRLTQKGVFRHASLSRRNDQTPKSLCLSSAFRGRLPYVAPFGLVASAKSRPVPSGLQRAAVDVSARAKSAPFCSSFLKREGGTSAMVKLLMSVT